MLANKKYLNADFIFITAALVMTAAAAFVCLRTPAGTKLGELIFRLKIEEARSPGISFGLSKTDLLYDMAVSRLGGEKTDGAPEIASRDVLDSDVTEAAEKPAFYYAANDAQSFPEVDLSARAVMSDAETVSGEVAKDKKPIVAQDYSRQNMKNIKLYLNNQTNLDVNLNDFLKRDYPVENTVLSDPGAPVALVLCTHATESYSPEGAVSYSPAFSGARSSDTQNNMIAVAKVFCDTLNANGVPAIQSFVMHDEVSYQNSYARSLETMNAYIAKYPTIKYVFDIHRDSIIDAGGVKYKPTVSVDGENSAQVMFVIGSNAGGGDHPGWKDNLTFAAYLQNDLNKYYPTLARPINLREVRFNQHTAPGAVIMEVGSCGNSLSEAKLAVRLVGTVLAELIKKHSK